MSRDSSQREINKRRRLLRFQPRLEVLERREVFSATPFLVPVAPSIEFTPLLTVGDAIQGAAQNGYRMVGIPDGMGAFDNGDGTFTVLMNQEINPTSSNNGVVRAHGSEGAFVSRWVIDKSSLAVIEGSDLIQTLQLWDSSANGGLGGYISGTTALNRLCSADLPDVTAFYNATTGQGTTERIFMNGEETSNGRAFAHVVSTWESWELPALGKFAWENSVASPYAQDKTIVMGLDDSNRSFSTEGEPEPSEVYVWIGNKQSTGTVIEKAGLVNGILHGMRVGTPGNYDANESSVSSGERFELVPLSDQTNNTTYAPLQAESIANTITQFRRVEDGHFDPTNPNVFYYVTTDQFAGATRLWKLTFDDIQNPETGGTIEIAFDSPASVPGEMFDNITVNANGDVLLQEDPGNQNYLARLWQFDSSSSQLIEVAKHNPALFDPNYAGSDKNFLTRDEESSGIIDLAHILGNGYYLVNIQAHYNFPATGATEELVQGGQLLVMNTNAATATLNDGVLTVTATINDDHVFVDESGNDLVVYLNGQVLGSFQKTNVDLIRVSGGSGDDMIVLDRTLAIDSLLSGDDGDDLLIGANGRDTLLGGLGNDRLEGRNNKDWLDGGDGFDWLFGGNAIDELVGGEYNEQ